MPKYLPKFFQNLSPVWIAPCLALMIAGILIWDNSINKGPQIELVLTDAQGIAAGKTKVKCRSVEVGTVTSVKLSDDYKTTVAVIQMDPGTEGLLAEDSEFYVITPRVTSNGISGLDTMLSGAYINIYQGKKPITEKKFKSIQFKVSNSEPISSELLGGKAITLTSYDSKKLEVGDAVTYQGIKIGQVYEIEDNLQTNAITHEIYIYPKYMNLVDSDSYFYIYSGVHVSVGPRGINFDVDMLNSIFQGGICMERTKFRNKQPEPATTFDLHKDKRTAQNKLMENYPTYVFFVNGGLNDMAVGSEVHVNGIQVGQVIETAWYENDNEIYAEGPIPIKIAITRGDSRYIQHLFEQKIKNRQLCAHVRSSSLLAYNDMVDLSLMSNSACTKKELDTYRGYPVIASVEVDSIRTAMNNITAQIKAIDIPGLQKEVLETMGAIKTMASGLNTTINDIEKKQTIARLNTALDSVSATMDSYKTTAPIYDSMQALLTDIRTLLHALEPTVKTIQQKPNSLIFNDSTVDPVPSAR